MAAVDVREQAVEYAVGGLSVIPILADGSKAASVKWDPYKSTPATQEEISRWFSNGKVFGIAIVC